jgi:hypothetical protein
MKKLFALLILGLILIPTVVFATSRGDDPTFERYMKCDNYTARQIAVTATNTTLTFSRDTKAIYVENIGSNEIYWDPADGVAVADTNHSKLEPDDNRSVSQFATLAIGFICSAGETSTVLVEVCQ